MISQASRATTVYGAGGFTEILVFRWQETGPFILPLLLSVVPYAAGLMLWGVAAWRSGVLREPGRHRRLLLSILSLGGMAGVIATGVKIFASSTGRRTGVPSLFLEIGSPVPLAMAYGAAVLLWLTPERVATVAAPFAAAGRMAFTNYLTQSVILGLIFYGYGFGLFGRIGSAAGAALGIGIYAAQLYLSRLWLRRYRFGPAEWLWRSLTYGRRQPMRAHRS